MSVVPPALDCLALVGRGQIGADSVAFHQSAGVRQTSGDRHGFGGRAGDHTHRSACVAREVDHEHAVAVGGVGPQASVSDRCGKAGQRQCAAFIQRRGCNRAGLSAHSHCLQVRRRTVHPTQVDRRSGPATHLQLVGRAGGETVGARVPGVLQPQGQFALAHLHPDRQIRNRGCATVHDDRRGPDPVLAGLEIAQLARCRELLAITLPRNGDLRRASLRNPLRHDAQGAALLGFLLLSLLLGLLLRLLLRGNRLRRDRRRRGR